MLIVFIGLLGLLFGPAPVRPQPSIPDGVPPQVVRALPADGVQQVDIGTTIFMEFSEPMQPSTLFNPAAPLNSNFKIFDADGHQLNGTMRFGQQNREITFVPEHRLSYDTSYRYELQGAQDASGEVLPDFEATFTTFQPQVIGSLRPGDPGTAMASANGIAYNEKTKTVVIANGRRLSGMPPGGNPNTTGLLLVDVLKPKKPAQIGNEIVTAGRASDVLLLQDVAITPRPCSNCQPGSPVGPVPLTGDFALVVSGSTQVFSNLRIYDVSAPGPATAPHYVGARLLSTPLGVDPRPPIPSAPGIPAALTATGTCQPAAPGENCIAYVATSDIGIQAVDIPQSIPRLRYLVGGGREPRSRIEGTFEGYFADIDFAAGMVLAAGNLSASGGIGLTVLTADLDAPRELPLPGASRVTGLEGFTIALDTDGDGSPDGTETYQLALVGGANHGLHVVSCPTGPASCTHLGSIPAPPGHPAYEIAVDGVGHLAYWSDRASAVSVLDLRRLFDRQGTFVQGQESCGNAACVDKDGDGTDDRIMGIVNMPASIAALGPVARESALDSNRGLLYLANDQAGLAVIRVQPVQAFFNVERAALVDGKQFRSTDRISLDEAIYLFDRDYTSFCLTIDSEAPADTTLRYAIHEAPFQAPSGQAGAVPGSAILIPGIHGLEGELTEDSQEICLGVNRSAFPSFFGSHVPIAITDEGGELIQELQFTVLPARIDGPDVVTIRTQVDRINPPPCFGSAQFTFSLTVDAEVTLEINGNVVEDAEDADGNPIGRFAGIPFQAGTHTIILLSATLQPASNLYRLKAKEIPGYPGEEIEDEGIVIHEAEINANLPIGHTMVKGVDIWDGHLTHSTQDIMIPGLGLSLDLTRTYGSSGYSSDGPLGAGWTHSYNIRLIEDSCGRFVVIGGEGSGNAFTSPYKDPAKAALFGLSADVDFFQPQIGYHSTLVRDPNRLSQFDFYTKAHIRYHFEFELLLSTRLRKIYTLQFIEDPNGNRVTLTYDELPPLGDADPATLDTVTDSSGRALVFEYEITDVFLKKRIRRLKGFSPSGADLLGLEIEYNYDGQGNLIKVTRKSPDPGANLNDGRVEHYAYTTTGALQERHNLLSYTDPNGHTTHYTYYDATNTIPGLPAFGVEKHEIVKSVVQPEGVITTFTYNFSSDPQTPNTREVSDPRPDVGPTTYTLNNYGAAVLIESPLGKIIRMEQCTDAYHSACPDRHGDPGIDVLMVTKIDAEGRTHRYEYGDRLGNLTKETIEFAGNKAPVTLKDGTTPVSRVVTTYTYDPVFSKMTSKTDAEENTTLYHIDAAYAGKQSFCPDPGRNTGNLLGVKDAKDNVTCYTYDDTPGFQGTLLGVKDPRGFITRYTRYDAYGNAEEIIDPEGNITTNIFDERSRLLETRDTFSHHVTYAYDGLDRKIREERFDDLGEGGTAQFMTYLYESNGELRQMTDGLGQMTEYMYDQLNRWRFTIEHDIPDPITGQNFIQMEHRYDEDSNVIEEIDYRGVSQIHTYDDLNRRKKTEVAGPFTGPTNTGDVLVEYAYDLVNNKLGETDLHGHTTTYSYDGLYRVAEIHLPFQNALIQTAYDRMGNKVRETDANGNPTTYAYDDIYRLVQKTDAYVPPNILTYDYDRADNKIREENLSSGLVTEWTNPDYDGLNRPRVMRQRVPLGGPGLTDAVYVTFYDYEDGDNAVLVTNPRLFKTRTDKDGLDRVFQTIVDVGGLDLTTTNTYDGNGNVRTIHDPEGGDIDLAHQYDGLNRKILSTYVGTPSDGGQPVTEEFAYDANDNLIRYKDKRGTIFTTPYNQYDNLNRVLEKRVSETITNSGTELTLMVYAYDDANTTVTETDANGNATATQSDGLHRPTIVDDPDPAGLLVYEHDGVNNRREIDKKGHCTAYDYDPINRLVLTREFESSCNGNPRTTLQVEYKDQDNRVEETDRRGIKAIRQLDALQRLVQLKRSGLYMATHYVVSEVLLETYEYDGNSNKTLFIHGPVADGRKTRYEYDGADRQITMTEGVDSPVEATTTYTYDSANNLLTVKDDRAHGGAFDMEYTYDVRYRKETATNGEGETTTYAYDANDNLVRMTEPEGPDFTTLYRYDEMNQLLAVDETSRADPNTAEADAGVTRFFYDGNRNKIAQQDANGNLVTYKYDRLNRLTDIFQHTLAGTLNDNTTRGSDPTGAFLDAGGDETSALHWQYGYDLNSNQNLVIDPREQQVDMTHDYLDRLETKTYSNHAEPGLEFQMLSIDYDYDDNSNVTCVTERKQVSGDPLPEVTIHTYDPLDRIQTRRHLDYDGSVTPGQPCRSDAGKLIQYDYDVQGNRTAVIDPDSVTTAYVYDERNRLKTATTEAGVTTYTWWEDSLIKKVEYPNSTVSDRSRPDDYDAADRALHIVNQRPNPDPQLPPTIFSEYTYTYDDNGNRLTQIETQLELPLANPNAQEMTTYRYDNLNRLRSATYGTGATLIYTYSPNGNRLTEVGTDPHSGLAVDRLYKYKALPGTTVVTFDHVNTLTQILDNLDPSQTVTYEYDRNLNQVAKEKDGVRTEFHYGIRDQILAADELSGTPITFDYDHDRMRIKKISGGTGKETRYLYDENSVLVEYDGAQPGRPTVHKYDYGYELLSLTEVNTSGSNRNSRFYLTDALMSTVNLTDEAGSPCHSYRYDAWGRIRDQGGACNNSRQYTGHYKDDETGLHYFGARYYDDETGRFLSQDPYLGEENTPPSLHRYLYAYGNPLRYVDLMGYASNEANSDGTNFEREEKRSPADPRGKAPVKSIAPSGRPVFDPEGNRTPDQRKNRSPSEHLAWQERYLAEKDRKKGRAPLITFAPSGKPIFDPEKRIKPSEHGLAPVLRQLLEESNVLYQWGIQKTLRQASENLEGQVYEDPERAGTRTSSETSVDITVKLLGHFEHLTLRKGKRGVPPLPPFVPDIVVTPEDITEFEELKKKRDKKYHEWIKQGERAMDVSQHAAMAGSGKYTPNKFVKRYKKFMKALKAFQLAASGTKPGSLAVKNYHDAKVRRELEMIAETEYKKFDNIAGELEALDKMVKGHPANPKEQERWKVLKELYEE